MLIAIDLSQICDTMLLGWHNSVLAACIDKYLLMTSKQVAGVNEDETANCPAHTHTRLKLFAQLIETIIINPNSVFRISVLLSQGVARLILMLTRSVRTSID